MTKTAAFTEARYREILRATAASYPCVGFEILDEPILPARFAVMRHDIDISPNRALALAQVEAELGIRATYTGLLTGDFYSPFESETRCTLKQISAPGHDVGLHFGAALHEIDSEKSPENALDREKSARSPG